ncbi:MAG: hypothetical protein PHQ12_09950, partial [Chthoniobacteraceae bacterium]|nr:hypothetical protein [Chthoniobacteraceae bacterium]
GLAWILQGIFGPGAVSYYGIPLFYVVCGGLLAFVLGARVFENRAAAWGCAIAYLFHPLLDDVIYRPMPDLSEGVFIAAAVLCWMSLAEREKARERLPWALAVGGVCALLYANRLTGVFVFGVLAAVAGVLSWRNPRFPLRQAVLWLGVAGLAWLAFVSLEGLLYHRICGDFFHSVTANLGARGRKGTESVHLLTLPFRFFGSLWMGGFLTSVFTVLAILGGWRMWRTGERRQRAIVAWAVALYLCYNCALQSVFPPRPLLRNADRFLCSLAVPMALLAWAGVRWLWTLWPAGLAWSRRRPVAMGCLVVVTLALIGDRDFFELGYLPGLRAAVRATPPGTRVFTHDTMRFAAMLADADAASRLQWLTEKNIFRMEKNVEERAAQADAFWYCRKHLWLSARKQLERDENVDAGRIASYLERPDPTWMLQRVVMHEDSPDFVFYRKRPAGVPNARRMTFSELCPQAPALPLRWSHGQTLNLKYRMPLPEALRGKMVRLEIEGKSDVVEAISVDLFFFHNGKRIQLHDIQPYLQHKRGIDFHALKVPSKADSCEAQITIAAKTKTLEIDQIWVVAEP